MTTEIDQSPIPNLPRRDLRQATLIVPSTGQRVRRTFTLRDPRIFPRTSRDESAVGERTPLLSDHSDTRKWRSCNFNRSAKVFCTRLVQWIHKFLRSREGQAVMKCSLAYVLASLAVFIPGFTHVLGSGDSKHLVANIVVWFHPGRSAGSMDHGALLAFLAFAYAAAVCYTSMGISTLFSSLDLQMFGHAFMLFVGSFGGFGLIAWIKQRYNYVLVNVSCSLAAIPIVTVLTKDSATRDGYFSHNTVSQVLRMMVLAILISTTVSLLIKPVYARTDLYESLIQTTDALADLLASITSSFLTGQEQDLRHPRAESASQQITSVFNSLDQTLYEARTEHYVLGTEEQYWIEKRLVQCVRKLAQDIGGLRSAASIQFTLLRQVKTSKTNPVRSSDRSDPENQHRQVPISPDSLYTQPIFTLPEVSDSSSIASALDSFAATGANTIDADELNATTTALAFSIFIEHLGPPMKSLAYTLNQILKELPFGPGPSYTTTLHSNFSTSLKEAMHLFDVSRREALELVYKSKEISSTKSIQVAADFEEVAASCGHFSASLQDLGKNCSAYLDTLEELDNAKTNPQRSWSWLLFWRKSRYDVLEDGAHGVHGYDNRYDDFLLDLPSLGTRRYYGATADREVEHRRKTFRYRLWKSLRPFRREDIRFSVKVGLGATALVMLAYIPLTQPLFHRWRLEWALATYMFVCAMTIGAANSTLAARLEGTALGASLAIVVWIVSQDSPYSLVVLGWLVSLGCFYLNLILNQGPMSRFTLLTYNLTVLYSYSLSVNDLEDDDDEGGINPAIWEIAFHRIAAVTLGILWGLFITQAVLPISARRQLKAGLSLLMLRMALIWKHAPLSTLVDTQPETPPYMQISEELKLRHFAEFLDTQRKSAEAEFMLRGPFPSESYNILLKSIVRILDAFHSLNVLVSKGPAASPGEIQILLFTIEEREQLAKRISHLFTVLASSLKLEFPLNDTLPSIQHTRDRLLAKVFQFRQDTDHHDQVVDADYELLYAYALVTAQIAEEIEIASRELGKLFGILSEDLLKLR